MPNDSRFRTGPFAKKLQTAHLYSGLWKGFKASSLSGLRTTLGEDFFYRREAVEHGGHARIYGYLRDHFNDLLAGEADIQADVDVKL